MSSDNSESRVTREKLKETVERYKRALAYLGTSTPFTYRKFVEVHKMAGLEYSEAELRHKWDMSEMMIEGTEGLKQILRDSLIDAINTFEPLIDKLEKVGTSQRTLPTHTVVSQPPINKWALASFILSLLSLCGGILTGIPAIVLGFIALRKIDESEGQTRGKGFAWAGIIVGLVLTAITTYLVLLALLSDMSAR